MSHGHSGGGVGGFGGGSHYGGGHHGGGFGGFGGLHHGGAGSGRFGGAFRPRHPISGRFWSPRYYNRGRVRINPGGCLFFLIFGGIFMLYMAAQFWWLIIPFAVMG